MADPTLEPLSFVLAAPSAVGFLERADRSAPALRRISARRSHLGVCSSQPPCAMRACCALLVLDLNRIRLEPPSTSSRSDRSRRPVIQYSLLERALPQRKPWQR